MSKPENWNEMTTEQQREFVIEFWDTARAKFIVGRALNILHHITKNDEPSDCEDAEMLGQHLFQAGWIPTERLSNSPANRERLAQKVIDSMELDDALVELKEVIEQRYENDPLSFYEDLNTYGIDD